MFLQPRTHGRATRVHVREEAPEVSVRCYVHNGGSQSALTTNSAPRPAVDGARRIQPTTQTVARRLISSCRCFRVGG